MTQFKCFSGIGTVVADMERNVHISATFLLKPSARCDLGTLGGAGFSGKVIK